MLEKELRLALVCYGGISLAVYMHGITKEIWQLNRASRDFHDGSPPGPATREVYRDLLQAIQEKSGTKLRVITDILSGSSAGGINAVFLAKSLVSGRSLDPVTDLWLNCADVDMLLDPDARPVGKFTKFWATPIAWTALRVNRTIDESVSPEARREVASKMSRFVRARWFAPPFGGGQFTGILLTALQQLEQGEQGPTLLPFGQPLDLFVSATDFYGYSESLRLHSPREVVETEHRLTFSFHSKGYAGVELASPPELAFAARATASFPGAFPPFRIDELDRVLAERNIYWPERDQWLRTALPKHYRQGIAEETVLIDGSVLSNAPFHEALRAIRNRQARRQVDRRFVYIDPLPDGMAFRFGGGDARERKLPSFFETIIGAASNIPREQPIRDNLERIELRSERARSIQRISANLRPEIEAQVEAMVGSRLRKEKLDAAQLENWRMTIQEKAAADAGLAYSAYAHLKLVHLADATATTIVHLLGNAEPERKRKLREDTFAIFSRQGLELLTDGDRIDTMRAITFFRRHDSGFRIRRMRFLARRLAEQVEDQGLAPVAITDLLHDAIYDALALCLERQDADFFDGDFVQELSSGKLSVEGMIEMLADRQGLVAMDRSIDSILAPVLAQLPSDAFRQMLIAYVGFPLFDIATLPLMEGEGQNEFEPIKVDRIAPQDATSLQSAGTLRGTEFHNFGAFFCRAYRENDYLWGRLHGAERLIEIVNSTVARENRLDEKECGDLKKRLFRAILNEERDKLGEVKGLVDRLLAATEKL